jgi:hypothetical protein
MNKTIRSIGRHLPPPVRKRIKRIIAPSSVPVPYEPDENMHWVDPRLIATCCADNTEGENTEFYIYDHTGQVIPGDWDIGGRKFKDLDIYVSTQMRLDGVPWHQTPFYARVVKIIESGRNYYASTVDELDSRCKKWDAMITSMKANGYVPKGTADEICVNIGRHGNLLFNNGRHRLAAAMLLRIPEVAIRITVRHPEWGKFKSEILSYAASHDRKVYAPLLHPDLENIPHLHTQERYEIILHAMSKQHKTLLDIGAHWGYFDIKFARIGMQCVAVEYGNLNTKMLTRMRTATGSNFINIQSSIFDVYPVSHDVILALSIFHHFLLKEESYQGFLTLLHRMDCKQLFVEAHNHHEAQMQDAYMKLESAELIDLIKRESNLKNSRKIGETTDNNGLTRPIYELWR